MSAFFQRAGAAATALFCCPGAHAQGIATERLLDAIVVTGERSGPLDVPGTTATRTAEDLRRQNLVNPEDALAYIPNVTIRKRYIGDRNSLIGGRSFSSLQAPRGLVLVDGYLLSNFLGRFDAPRWNMVAPEELARIDTLYGPFSALYPGNSIGTTVLLTTRAPETFEASVRTTGFMEQFREYGYEDEYGGWQLSGYLGNRLDNGAWFALAANRQDATSHPMQYFTLGEHEASAVTAPVAVTGMRFDRDPQGNPRAVFGANSGAIDHAIQTQVKLRGGYRGEWISVDGFVARWDNNSSTENRTFLRDVNGAPVWSGPVTANGLTFDVPLHIWAPARRDEQHRHWGATVRTHLSGPWNASVVYSAYDIDEDVLREAGLPDPLAEQGGPGTTTFRDGTGWRTFELQALYTPRSAHSVAFGYHQNAYTLNNPVYVSDGWQHERGELNQFVTGRTRLRAAYVQDEWQVHEKGLLTLGLRYEAWRAFDGLQTATGVAPRIYERRSQQAFSPKASFHWELDAASSLRLSYGRAVRFPTVSELFQGSVRASGIIENDPDLKAERSNALDLTWERAFDAGTARVTVFQDDVRDSIWGQTNLTVTPRVTNVQNVGRVRTRGVETAFGVADLPIENLRIEGSVAYTVARILENTANPPSEGKFWPRVPRWRGNLQVMWTPTPAWLASMGLRYSGRAWNTLDNSDRNPDVYGGVSRLKSLDVRAAYTTDNNVELALGIDNLTDERAWQSHPYPGRTFIGEVRWSLEGTR